MNWTTLGFSLGIDSIERAYETAKKAFEDQSAFWGDQVDQHRRAIGADFDEGDCPGDAQGYDDYLINLACEAENGLALLREAFALMLYHFWEKKACELFGAENYVQKTIFDKAKYARTGDRKTYDIDIDEAGIERLRFIAKTIKHNDGQELFKMDPSLFKDVGLIEDRKSWRGWHTCLQLKHEDILRGISAIRTSRPGPGWHDDSPVFIEEEATNS